MKKIVVDNYEHDCHFGKFKFNDVTIYVDDHSLNADNFNQAKNDYSLLNEEIEKLEHRSVGEFLKTHFYEILKDDREFTHKNLRGFLTYTKLKAVDLATLTGHSKGTISKMLKSGEEEYPIKKVTTHFLISLLLQEYREHGYCRRLLGLEPSARSDDNFPLNPEKENKVANG